MKKILNILFVVLKWILLFASFSITFYIILSMYDRINKSLVESFDLFIPYVLVFILFVINFLFKQETVTENTFYNVTCCLVFTVIVIVGLRAIYDKNMILNKIMGYEINFSYFNDFLSFLKVLLYGLSIGNILFMIHERKQKLNKNSIATKVDYNHTDDGNIEVL